MMVTIIQPFNLVKVLAATLFLLLLTGVSSAKDFPVYKKMSGDFTLTGHNGEPVNLSDYEGQVVLLNFGYTHCPDICPMVLARLSQAYRLLESHQDEVQVLFVSFDVERDSPERLKEYLKFFNPDFMGLTGTKAEMQKVASQYGVMYQAEKSESAAGTLYSHSDFIYLIDSQGRTRGIFDQQDSVHEIKDDVVSLLE